MFKVVIIIPVAHMQGQKGQSAPANVNLSIICLLVGPKINTKSKGDPDIQKNKIRGM